MREIEIRIKNGKASVEAIGVEDASCSQLTKALIEALGDVEEVHEKPQYYIELEDMAQKIYEE